MYHNKQEENIKKNKLKNKIALINDDDIVINKITKSTNFPIEQFQQN